MKISIPNCGKTTPTHCPKSWEDLTVSEQDNVRFCQECSQKVYLCQNEAEIAEHLQDEHIVARREEDKGPSSLPTMGKLKRVRRRRPAWAGYTFPAYVNDLAGFDEGVLRAFQALGRVLDDEWEEILKSRNESQQDRNDGHP